jgi:hypothetical protein
MTTTVKAPPRIRPGWVWGIVILYIVSTASAIFTQVLRVLNVLPTTPVTDEYYSKLTTVDWVLTVVIGAIQLIAAVLLWLLRRQALWLFAAAFFLGTGNFIWQILGKGLGQIFASFGVIGVVSMIFGLALGLILSAAILAYVWSLCRNGVLT